MLTTNFSKTKFLKLIFKKIFVKGHSLLWSSWKNWLRGVKKWSTPSDRNGYGASNFISTSLSNFILSKNHIYINHIDFFSIEANVCAQKSLKRTCPGSNPVMPLPYHNKKQQVGEEHHCTVKHFLIVVKR